MTTQADRALTAHPEWCTKKHQLGASRARQSHLHTWRSSGDQGRDWKIELYPSRVTSTSPRGDLSIRMYDSEGTWFWWWPDFEDARSFAHTILEVIDQEVGRA